jgi:nitroreductase
MDALEAIFNRRSTRSYTDRPLTGDMLDTLLKAAMYAPSAVNKQPWHFIVFRDHETIRKIIAIHPNAAMLGNSQAAVLVCWDEHRQHDTGYGPIDCAAATQNMLLAAHSMGIGSVWVGIYPRTARMEVLAPLFNLPPHIKPFSVVSLGFPAEKRDRPERFDPGKIHYEKW